MYQGLTLSPLLLPKPTSAGRSKTELVERRLAVMEACAALLRSMQSALPEDGEYDASSDANAEEARKAWRERMGLVETLQDEIAMEAMKITLDWHPNS